MVLGLTFCRYMELSDNWKHDLLTEIGTYQCSSQNFFPAGKVGDLWPSPLNSVSNCLLFDLNELLMKEGPKIHNTTFL